MSPRTALALALALSAGLACKRVTSNLCPNFEVAAEEADAEDDPGPQAWYGGMVATINTGTLLPPSEIRDCREKLVEPPANQCDDLPEPAQRRRVDRPLTADDIVQTKRGGDDFLLWTQVHHFDDGTALGPVAVASKSRRGVQVSALGSLRAASQHARLRLEPLGDGLVLLAEGSACVAEDDCRPVTRVVPLVGQQFHDRAMRLPDGGCGGPATFPLVDRRDIPLDATKTRQFRLQRNIVIKDGIGVIHEEAVATDINPQEVDVPGVEFRRESKARELLLDKETLIITPGIWEQFIAKHGSVRPSDHSEPTLPAPAAQRAPNAPDAP